MRRLIVGLVVAGVLAGAGPALAQPAPGTADPLGLISSGGIVPYFALPSGGNLGFLEVASPVGDNSSLTIPFHLIFFNQTCVRGDSVDLELTVNDLAVLDLGAVEPDNGLVAFGGSLDGINLVPLSSPVHVRVFQASLVNDFVRVLEPISAINPEASPLQTWNPLRTGATFFAPPDGTDFISAIYFVCPDSNVIDTGAPPQTGGVFPTTAGFPPHVELIAGLISSGVFIQGRVYDDEEDFLRDVTTDCDCLTKRRLADISTVYADTAQAPLGTYTELLGGSTTAGASFTGFRSIVTGGLDVWGRLSNANRFSITDGVVNPVAR
jgi:hypothetical protein